MQTASQLPTLWTVSEDQVRVIYPAIGGAFGGREDLSVQIVLALAVLRLRKPVKIVWSRRESIVGHGKRHPVVLRARWAATKDGKLLAAENEIIGDAGAYMYTSNKVLGNAAITSTGPYFIPNVKTDVYGVYTNNIPGAAFRGFGAPQALFMAEGQMNKLAAKLGLDPVDLRLRNALRDGLTMGVGTPAPGPVSVPEVIEAAARKFGWQAALKPSPRADAATLVRGRGFAAGFKNVGFSFGYQENSWAKVEIHGHTSMEQVILHHAGAEVGQGTHTVMAQMAAEVLGVSLDLVKVVTSDSAGQRNAGSVVGFPNDVHGREFDQGRGRGSPGAVEQRRAARHCGIYISGSQDDPFRRGDRVLDAQLLIRVRRGSGGGGGRHRDRPRTAGPRGRRG